MDHWHTHSPVPEGILSTSHQHEDGEHPHSHPVDAMGRQDTSYGGVFYQAGEPGEYMWGALTRFKAEIQLPRLDISRLKVVVYN